LALNGDRFADASLLRREVEDGESPDRRSHPALDLHDVPNRVVNVVDLIATRVDDFDKLPEIIVEILH
jgi:hypothetical protein